LAGTALVIIEEAINRGIRVELPFDNFKLMWIYINPDSSPVEIRRTLTHSTSPISMAITIDKSLSYQVANSVGMRLLPWIQTYSDQEALSFYKNNNGNSIIKPAKGQAGRGIVTSFHDERDFLSKFQALRSTDSVVIQAKSTGRKDVRLLFIGNKFSAATETRCSEVIGDGHSSFAELIETENSSRRETNNSRMATMLLKEIDIKEACTVSGIQSGVVLREGQSAVASLSNVTKGGIAADVSEIIHQSFIDEASKLVNRLNLPVVAVDFICDEIEQGRSIGASNAYFLEANSSPGIDLHMFPHEGKGVNVAGMFIDYLASSL